MYKTDLFPDEFYVMDLLKIGNRYLISLLHPQIFIGSLLCTRHGTKLTEIRIGVGGDRDKTSKNQCVV